MPFVCPQCQQQVPTGQTVCSRCRVDVLDIADSLPPFVNPEVGQVLANRYALVRYLGRGAMGMVYRARDQTLDLEVAIKVLPAEVARDGRAVAVLKHEARTAMSLSHPQIVRVYHFEEAQGLGFLIMEFVDGPTLADILGRSPSGRLALTDVVHYCGKLCAGLAYAHERGVIHRDLKPANVMLTGAGEVKITDFGLAWVVRDSLSRLSGRPLVGTLAYMSPEQAMGERVDQRSDIYALGCVLYELLSGEPPFVSGDLTSQHRYKQPAPIEGLSARVNATILKALAKDPGQRWQTALEMRAALAGWAQAGEVQPQTRVARQQGGPRGAVASDDREAAARESLRKTLVNSIGMEFVLIPAGRFLMGSDDGDDDERPVHQVTISRPFCLGTYPVTQGEWEAVMGGNSSYFKGDPNLPVESVSWKDVQGFIHKLNAREEHTKYRLPTEAEWEYAARAGSTTAYSFGDAAGQLNRHAWYGENAGGSTHPVGQLRPNAWGLYDMHGNVWEWVQDWYGAYRSGTVSDPQGPPSGSTRVVRGGGWAYVAELCRSADRYRGAPGNRTATSASAS